MLEDWMRSYRPEELFDDAGRPCRGTPRAGARAAGCGWAPRRTPTAASCCAGSSCRTSAPTPSVCDEPGDDVERGDAGARRLPARRRAGQPADVPPVRARRDGLEPARRRVRGDRPDLVGGARAGRRPPRAGRPRHGGAERAPVPGLAGGLPAHRPPRPLLLLRGVHPHRRLDVQPAREVAEGHPRHPVAPPDRVAQLPAHVARLAPGPQRLLPPGPGLHRPRGQQEGGDHPRLPAAGRELPALRRRPLPAQPQLRERDRGGQAARPRLPRDGRGDRALHPRPRDLELGGQRARRAGAGRRARLRRRCADARDGRRRGAPARAPARTARARGQRRRPDAAAVALGAPARARRPRVRRALHAGQAGHLRLSRLSVADPPADLPAHATTRTCTCAATRRRARRRRRSTW